MRNCTWWIRLFSSNSRFKFLMYVRLRESETNIVFPGEYFKSNSYFCKRRNNFWIRGRQLTTIYERLLLMAGDHWLLWICVHKSIYGISQHQKLWKGFAFRFGRNVFCSLELIVMHIQQDTILVKLGFYGFVLEGRLILQSVCQFSNGFVD